MAEFLDTFFDIFAAGGWSTVPILLCLMLGLAIIIERSLYLRSVSMRGQAFVATVREDVRAGDLGEAIEVARAAGDAALARVVKAGLMNAHRPPKLIRAAVDEAVSEQLRGLTRRPALLGLGMLAVLIGLYDTVIEMLPSFNCGMWVDPPLVRMANHISWAMGPAVVGLAVGLVALVGHALIGAWCRKLEDQVHHGAAMVLNLVRSCEQPESNPRGS